MPVKIGGLDLTKAYVGTAPVTALYQGANLVWSAVPPWKPTDLTGCSIWWDAADVGTITTIWPDKSGLNHHGSVVGSPAPATQPAALNGKSVVRFKASEGRIRATSTGVTKDYTLFVVERMWGATKQRALSGNYPGSNTVIGYHTGSMDAFHEGAVGFFVPDTKRTADTTWQLYTTDAASTPSFLPRGFINGVYKNVAANGNGEGLNNRLNISGYDATGTQETSDCEVAEVVVYNRKLSDADRQQVESYLRTKWAVGI